MTPVPTISAPHQDAVETYQGGPDAPQKGTDRLLDTLDGRLKHAVSSIDPRTGKIMVWTSHSVLGGAGTQARWYEIQPSPMSTPSIFQSGVATHSSLYVYNDGISSDRTVNPGGAAHGSNVVKGFTTSSGTTFSADRMVSKVGAGAQSAFVLVKMSPGKNEDFTCPSTGSSCRWATTDHAGPGGLARGQQGRGVTDERVERHEHQPQRCVVADLQLGGHPVTRGELGGTMEGRAECPPLLVVSAGFGR